MVRRTKKQIEEAKEFADRERKTKQYLTEQFERSNKLRSQEREFHGLNLEFMDHQKRLLAQYEESKKLHHIRDKGDVREVILREFLSKSGLLPRRYCVSDRSMRVISPTGHSSKEIDIAISDEADSISLMRQSTVYEALPVETVYGVIQVKSSLTKSELKSGLENIASFKRLRRSNPPAEFGFKMNSPELAEAGFGLLFAYSSSLEWLDTIAEIRNFAATHPRNELANGIFVLTDGFFMHGDKHQNRAAITNMEISKINELQMHGRPDRESLCLWNFYYILLELLRGTTVQQPQPMQYFRLPEITESTYSYQFMLGPFAEVGKCEKHGDYQRKISAESLKTLIDWCRNSKPIDISATNNDIIGGRLAGAPPAKGGHYVRVYNPENLPLNNILSHPEIPSMIAYDMILSEDMEIYIPYYYSFKENIISECQQCANKKPSKGRSKT